MDAVKTRDPEATRQAILEAAEEIFLEKGFADTSMSQIAKEAGVTKSLIHHHFVSKENLWNEVKRAALEEFAVKQQEIRQRGEVSLGTLMETAAAYFRFIQHNPKVIRMMAWMTVENLQGGHESCMHDDLIEDAISQVAEAQRRGIIRNDVPPFHVVVTILSMIHGWFQDRCIFQKWLVADDSAEASAAADDVFLGSALRFLIEGIRGENIA